MLKKNILPPFISQKIAFYSFLSMLLLVFVHSYNLKDTYLQPWTIVEEKLTTTTFVEYLFSNGLLRFRIPMLFVISGYLYAMTDYKPYKERTRKRLLTLGVPYLLWSLIALLVTWGLEYSPLFLASIRATHLAQISETAILVSQYAWWEWLIRLILAPIAFQLWFIRVLLVYNLAYPTLRLCVEKMPVVWFVITSFLWVTNFGVFFIEGEGLFFFTLGIWLQKTQFDIAQAPFRSLPRWLLVLFVSSALLKTYLAFQSYTFLGGYNAFLINILFKITELSGMIGIWYGCDALVRWAGKTYFFAKGQNFSFIVYALHVPILYYLMYVANSWLAHYVYHRLLTFIAVPIVVILFCILVGVLLRACLPKLYSILTGGRGNVTS